jgi:4-hydroxyphenylacetaldehyde oxime monooxygenase
VAFAPYGEQWREMRKLFVTEFVSMRRVKAAWGARQAQVEKLMAGLTPNTPVALGERIYGLVNGIICTVAFGNVYGAEMFHRVLGEALELQASFSAEDFFPNAAGRLVDRLTGLAASRDRSFAAIDTFLEVVIEQHLEPKSEREGSDLVDVLINLSKEQPAFTRDNVKAILMVRAC